MSANFTMHITAEGLSSLPTLNLGQSSQYPLRNIYKTLVVLTFALESLFEQSEEHRSTVVTEGARCPVGVHRQQVRANGVIILLFGVGCSVCVYSVYMCECECVQAYTCIAHHNNVYNVCACIPYSGKLW